MSHEPVAITLEFTPNPNTLKFVINRQLMERGAANFLEKGKTEHAPLARKLFDVPGIQAVMIGTNFVTVTKSPSGEWDVVAEQVPKTIELHLVQNGQVFDAEWKPEQIASSGGSEPEVEKRIREVLDNEIRPAVAMDGGDIVFGRYENGVVYLQLQGSCSSCPSATATLRMGVETRLKEVIPEVKEVVQM